MFVQRAMRQATKAQTILGASPSKFTAKVLSSSRLYSTPALAPLDASKLEIKESKNKKALQENSQLVFGKTFTDNMLTVEWEAGKGWGTPQIKEYGKLQLDPSAVVFHYAFECFEGMKAYKDKDGKTRLFRPDMNMKRFNRSAQRIALPVRFLLFTILVPFAGCLRIIACPIYNQSDTPVSRWGLFSCLVVSNMCPLLHLSPIITSTKIEL